MIRHLTGLSRHWNKQLVDMAIIIAVLALSSLIGWRSSSGNLSKLILMIPISIGAVLAGLWLIPRYHWGLLFLITTALFVPFEIGTGTAVSINAAMILLALLFGLWVFDALVLKREIRLPNSRLVYILLGLCAAALISFGIGQLDWFAFAPHAPIKAQLGGLGLYFLCAIAFMLPILFINDIVWLKRMTWLFLVLCAGYVLGISLPGFGIIRRLYNPPATGSVFWIWAIALSLSQGLLNKKLGLGLRAALIGLTLATLATSYIYNEEWKSGWVPAVATAGIILLIAKPKIGIPVAIIAGTIGLIYLRGFIANPDYSATSGESYSLLTRLEAWQILGQIIPVNPITGLGPANYHFYATLYPLRGYYVEFNSHNQYVDLVAQTGVVGLGLFLWFCWEIWRLGWKLKSRAAEGFERAYAIGALGGLAGMLASGMLGDWVIPFVYNIGFPGFQASMIGWLFLGGLVVIEFRHRGPTA